MIYGKLVLTSGKVLHEGLNIQEVLQLSHDMDECEQDLSEMMGGDLALGPQLVRDLANRIIELESKLGSQNS
ncbi:hypothetical protein Fifi44_00028 [Erwinia phage Fifi44]|uniref:Uncharacterized protein n=1 Tax=Erwinia phage Fifi44 TaxID=2876597 RepID=A0AAE8Y380_9CAUD|nr:hypothetical protein QNG95_gp28 [Erwinia phage Fifi44]UCR74897.1 hypothetical protein Fifi44_00028 [Erwinia phage Fifi44]UCR80869.1 hypothetical protein Fifi451_00049 [Erwinia phage Fifi451]